MPIHVRDPETDRLAAKSCMGLTDAIRTAVEHELARLEATVPLHDRVAKIRLRIAARLGRLAQTDKEFFDELSGDPRCSSAFPLRRMARRFCSSATTFRKRTSMRPRTKRASSLFERPRRGKNVRSRPRRNVLSPQRPFNMGDS
jgi:antitoxin VapB